MPTSGMPTSKLTAQPTPRHLQDRARVGVHNAVALFNGRALKSAPLQPQPPTAPRAEAAPHGRRAEAWHGDGAEEGRRDSICSIVEDEADADAGAGAAAVAEGSVTTPEGDGEDDAGGEEEEEEEEEQENEAAVAGPADGQAEASEPAAAQALPHADADTDVDVSATTRAMSAEPAAIAKDASAADAGPSADPVAVADESADVVGVADEPSATDMQFDMSACPAVDGAGADVPSDLTDGEVGLKFEPGVGAVSADQDRSGEDDMADDAEASAAAAEAEAEASEAEGWDNSAALVSSLGAEAVASFRWCIVDTQVRRGSPRTDARLRPPCRSCTGTGPTPCHNLHWDWTGLTPATSAPGLGSPRPHLHRDWAHPCHNLHREWARPCHNLHPDWARFAD